MLKASYRSEFSYGAAWNSAVKVSSHDITKGGFFVPSILPGFFPAFFLSKFSRAEEGKSRISR
jgi:hypothetical protein